jgi:hypothetical protein
MLTWLWRRIRFSVPGQLIWESVASAKRFFDASIVGHYFYKLPKLARVLIIAVPILLIALAPVGIYYAYQTTEATGRVESRRPGEHLLLMEGTTLTALDDVQLEFPPTLATDDAGVTSYLQPLDLAHKYVVEFHKDPRGERVDKILVRLKSGTRLRIASDVGTTIAKEGDKPKRFQIHLMGE